MITSQLAAKRKSIQVVALSILVIAGIAVVAIHGLASWQLRRLQVNNAEISTANVARALADQASSAFKMVDTVLVAMVDRVEAKGLSDEDKDQLRSLMARHVKELPALQGLFIYDEEGRWIVNSGARAYDGRNNADRDYFKFHLRAADRGVHIGAPIVGRTSGAWVIPVSRRLEYPDGRFAGVVLATIKIDFFRKVYEGIDLRRDGKIVLGLKHGVQLLAMPFSAAEIGKDIGASPLFARFASTLPRGGLIEIAEMDHEYIYGMYQAGDYPVVVAFARSKDEVLKRWRELTITASAILLVLAAGMGILGVHLIRQIRRRDHLECDLLAAKVALEASNAALLTQSQTDPLTGLFNKRYFEEALERELAHARRAGTPLSALMIDVDHFKKYNDCYGHLAGDTCLAAVAQTIRTAGARPRDVAARFGGEEFVVLLPETDLAGAAVVAESVRASLEARHIAHQAASSGFVTASIGVSTLTVGGGVTAASALMESADAALYAAKASGRNCVKCAPEDIRPETA